MNPATVARSALLALPLAFTLTVLGGAPASLAQTQPQVTQPAPTTAPAAMPQSGQVSPGQGSSGQATSPRPASQAAPAGRQTNPGQAPQAAPQAGPSSGRSTGGRRRPRVSYATCNRQAHARGLRGGARRRFLIRCKLGYEAPRPAQAAPARQP